jgi:flagellar hook-associated protein 1 FlgK
MTSVSPLNIALSGLRSAQALIGVASNNIANASTDGYTKKTLAQYTVIVGGQGGGVDVGLVQRRINDILMKDFRKQVSVTSGLATTQDYLRQVQELHGTPNNESSITSQIGRLKDSFAQLANSPESQYLLTSAYNVAQRTVQQFSSYSTSITQLRNTVQSDMTQSVNTINSLTQQIVDLNVSIKAARNQERTSADLEDQRDLAIRKLSEEVDVSYFTNQDGTVTVMTHEGQLLAHDVAVKLYFKPEQLGVQSYYPVASKPLMLGDPIHGTDITNDTSLGGRMGALVKLRDETLPTYQAQIDELAYQLASRFSAEGLNLFTMPNGSIPANTPSAYVGFADAMVVNPAIVSDTSLIRKGTNPLSTVQAGSSEVLRKIIEFTFGDVAYHEAVGTANITTGPTTLFAELGLSGQARIIGDQNVQAMSSVDADPAINENDTFTLQVGAGLPQTVTITASMTPAALVAAINTAIPGTAALSSGGQLILTAPADLTIGSSGPNAMSAAGLAALGFTAGVTTAQPPSFTIASGNNDPTTITITSADTGATLLAKINSVSGITASIVGGHLEIRPTEGGDISIIDGLKNPLQALGMTITEVPHTAFNSLNLGPGANLDGRISGSPTLLEYATQLVGTQSQDSSYATSSLANESVYKTTLESQLINESGVNIDEEMAQLISIQTAYSASARTITVVQQMMDELLNAIRR